MSAVFQVQSLKKAFGGLAVTQDVSITLNPGDRVALIGPNGAGKTTFVNLVTGHLVPDSGKVILAGNDVTSLGPTPRVRQGLVRSFQVTRKVSWCQCSSVPVSFGPKLTTSRSFSCLTVMSPYSPSP